MPGFLCSQLVEHDDHLLAESPDVPFQFFSSLVFRTDGTVSRKWQREGIPLEPF